MAITKQKQKRNLKHLVNVEFHLQGGWELAFFLFFFIPPSLFLSCFLSTPAPPAQYHTESAV